jgi:spore germination protein YaaH
VVLNDSGSVEVRATQDYVDAAHQMGMAVWAVLDNFNGPDGVQQKFLRSDEARSAIISKTVETVRDMGIEGINVDIEGITDKYGPDFIEFVRELSIECRNNGIVMSVDNYVPYNFNDHYRIDEQGLFADYVVIMGYDEHYAGSQEPGSVASIGYVTYGIEEALNYVTADKLINGIPFYTRIWKTTAEGVSSVAYGMDQTQTFIANHNMAVEWNEASGQNYAEVSEDDATYQIWIEDVESIERKLEVMEANNIIGVAEWCLGMESSNVWDVIADYMGK